MIIIRRFLIASSLARLVARERGSTPITEGYFEARQGGSSHVVVEGERCHLVLTTDTQAAAPVEERTEVPRSHAEALLEVCAGTVSLQRSRAAAAARR
jgi:CYTH domain-containing protein